MPHFDEDVCMDCGGCVGVCPHDSIDLVEGFITFLDTCTECNLCVSLCPVGAIDPMEGPPRREGWTLAGGGKGGVAQGDG